MKMSVTGAGVQPANAPASAAGEGEKKLINEELWQACSGPLVNLPAAGTHVVYFPQGHSEQVAASMKKDVEAQIPNYSNLPSKLLCQLHSVTLHADPETDEVYAQMTLQPVASFEKDDLLRSDLSMKVNKPQTDFFCKTLTASDTSTHGGFSVPRRAAEKIFPPLDFTMQPPAQELVARDLHDNVWTFRHIYRGQPKRHLLTTGWSLFVSGKRLFAGDSVLFIRDEKQQLLLGIRRANRQPPNLSSSVLSSDSMHIGILAAAAHAAANNSPFTVFYNPRSSPSEFVIPLAKYYKAVCSNQISLGMRFRMMFETEESGTRRYMGTITGISDMDGVRWKNSQWRNLQVGWDETSTCERRTRVSVWEIEPVTAPFFICPTPPFFRSKRQRQPGMPDDEPSDLDNIFRRTMPWLGEDFGLKDPNSLPGLSLVQWMNMQQNPLANQMQPSYANPVSQTDNISRQLGQISYPNNSPFNSAQQLDQQLQSSNMNPLGPILQPQQQLTDLTPRQNLFSQMNQVQPQILQQQLSLTNHPIQRNLSQNLTNQQQNMVPNQTPNPMMSQQLHMSENQIQLQLLQKLHQRQQQSLLLQQSGTQLQDQQKQILDTPQSNIIPQQNMMAGNNIIQTNLQFAQPPQQQNNTLNLMNHRLSSTQQYSAVTIDDIPSCSTSPPIINGKNQATITPPLNSNNLVQNFQPKSDVRPSLNVPEKSPNQEYFSSQMYANVNAAGGGTQIDYLDSSSSATSVLSQNDVQIPPQNNNSVSFNNDVTFGANIDDALVIPMMSDPTNIVGPGKDFAGTNISSGGGLIYENNGVKEVQPELSSSMVSQSFGVPDMTFNSIDSTIDDGNFMNGVAWGPPQMPRMRTYTKVYKRGAVGRSIDITRYTGYTELKQDLARRFGIEGQLEDRQRIGWKLVYVDHENDVLLVGDDPWEEFVNCVRCIKILSPQEVQQMSLDGDFETTVLPNQDCSSSDNGVN